MCTSIHILKLSTLVMPGATTGNPCIDSLPYSVRNCGEFGCLQVARHRLSPNSAGFAIAAVHASSCSWQQPTAICHFCRQQLCKARQQQQLQAHAAGTQPASV